MPGTVERASGLLSVICAFWTTSISETPRAATCRLGSLAYESRETPLAGWIVCTKLICALQGDQLNKEAAGHSRCARALAASC